MLLHRATTRLCSSSSSSSSSSSLLRRRIPRHYHRFQSTSVAEKAAPSPTAAASKTSQSSSSDTSVPVAKSLFAALLGVTTVSATAAVVENATASSVPPFDPRGERFDQGTFVGRFSRMLLSCDPRLLLYSTAQVRQAQALLEEYASGNNNNKKDMDDRALWEAKRMVDAALNDGEVVPRPFRMAGYVPYNGPICVAMVASQSTPALLFWSWVNQSQNALINYFNRNASSPMSNETLVKSYAIAVGSALTVAFGLATAIQKRYNPAQAKALLRWVAFPSAVVASSLNCYIVRSPEMDAGIVLETADGTDVLPGQRSQIAATRGVHLTTASRALLQAPVYFLPPVLLATAPIKRYLTANPQMTVPVTTFLLLVSFGVGLPATIGLFPQISTISADQVEPKFQQLRDPATQQPYAQFYYNKGL